MISRKLGTFYTRDKEHVSRRNRSKRRSFGGKAGMSSRNPSLYIKTSLEIDGETDETQKRGQTPRRRDEEDTFILPYRSHYQKVSRAGRFQLAYRKKNTQQFTGDQNNDH